MLTGVSKGNPTSVRLPERVRNRVAELATAERRSFNNMLVMLIEDGLEAWADDTIEDAAPVIGDSPEAAEPIRQANGPNGGPGEGNEPVSGAAPRGRRLKSTGMCVHRVRAGQFCKRCDKVIE